MLFDKTGKWFIDGRYWVRISDGRRLPIIQGGTSANTVQNARFAFGDDDGSESGHSLDTENAARTSQAADVTFLIRIQVEETNSKIDPWTFHLYADKNSGGTYTAVTRARTDGLRLADDTQSRADEEATTERLTAGAGSWQAGEYDDGGTTDGMSGNISLNGTYTDLEFAIEIDSANAATDDYWDLRIESSAGGDLDNYLGTMPRVTAAAILSPIEITPAAVAAGADSVNPTVQLGSIDVSPTTTVAGADSVDPTTRLGSLSVTPTVSIAGADSIGPSVAVLIILVPTTDDLRNGWTDEGDGTTSIYQSIDESPYSDSDYIQSSDNPSTEIYRTKLTSANDPASSDNHIVRYRYKHNGETGTINLIVRLKEGTTTVRATWTHNDIGATIVNAEQTLSGAQADSITDYSNLYLEFEANEV